MSETLVVAICTSSMRLFDVAYADPDGKTAVRRIEARDFTDAEFFALAFVPPGENFRIHRISENDANLYDTSASYRAECDDGMGLLQALIQYEERFVP